MSYIQSGSFVGSTINDVPSSATIIGHLAEIGQELNDADYPALAAQIGKAYCDDLIFTGNTSPIVTMTADTTVNGDGTWVASASNTYADASYLAWNAFKNNAGATGWSTAAQVTSNQWLSLSFPVTKTIYKIAISAATSASNGIRFGHIVDSSNNRIIEIDRTSYDAGTWYTYELSTPKNLNYIKLNAYGAIGLSYISAAINLFSNVFTSFYIPSHPYSTGDAVQIQAFGGSPHTGLSENTTYYVRKVDADHIKLYPTYNDAVNDTNQIIPTAVSSVPVKIYKTGKFKLKDSRNGIYTNFIKY